MKITKSWLSLAVAFSLAACGSESPEAETEAAVEEAAAEAVEATAESAGITKRPFEPMLDGEWIGNGISYGAFRDGEAPGDVTSKENILEDLQILAPRWKLIRLYGADLQ